MQLQENCDDLAGRIAACASELVRSAKRLHMDKVTLDDDEVFLSASAREVQHYAVKGSKRMGNNTEENTVPIGLSTIGNCKWIRSATKTTDCMLQEAVLNSQPE